MTSKRKSEPAAFRTQLAGLDDDEALRDLCRLPIPGEVTVSYEREPSYFLGCRVTGETVETLTLHYGEQLVAMCTRALRNCYINGSPTQLGYISQLRIAPEFQGRMLLARGVHFFRERDAQDPPEGYITTLTSGNATAEGVLIKRARRGYPTLSRLATLHTLALILRRRRVARSPFSLRAAQEGELEKIVTFLNRVGADKQFYPHYQMRDFLGERTLGLKLADLVLASEGEELVGVAGLWDQYAYKQTVIRSYTPSLQLARPFYNAYTRLRGGRPLPAAGKPIPFIYASFICIKDNREDIFASLLDHLYQQACARGYTYLMLGLCTTDPLLQVATRLPHLLYESTLYSVDFGKDFFSSLDARVPFLEIATL